MGVYARTHMARLVLFGRRQKHKVRTKLHASLRERCGHILQLVYDLGAEAISAFFIFGIACDATFDFLSTQDIRRMIYPF